MKFGIMHSDIFDAVTAVDMAVRAEGLGYDSFWTTDFALGPTPDPMALLAAASQRTERILLATAVMVLPYRHPVALAKTVATIDVLSNGRLVLGLGVGSNKKEFDAMGLDIHQRGRMADEKLALLRRLLSEEGVTYRGKFHEVEDVDVGPESRAAASPSDMAGAAVEKRTRRSDGQEDGKARGRVHTILGAGIPIRSGAGESARLRRAGRSGPGRHRVWDGALVLPGRRPGAGVEDS